MKQLSVEELMVLAALIKPVARFGGYGNRQASTPEEIESFPLSYINSVDLSDRNFLCGAYPKERADNLIYADKISVKGFCLSDHPSFSVENILREIHTQRDNPNFSAFEVVYLSEFPGSAYTVERGEVMVALYTEGRAPEPSKELIHYAGRTLDPRTIIRQTNQGKVVVDVIRNELRRRSRGE